MSNIYETIVIYDSNHFAESSRMFCDQLKEYTGKEIIVNSVGIKNLAYEIKKHTRGYYETYTWKGTAEQLHEFERCLRINDDVLKFCTINQNDNDELIEKLEAQVSEQKKNDVDAYDVLLGRATYD